MRADDGSDLSEVERNGALLFFAADGYFLPGVHGLTQERSYIGAA